MARDAGSEITRKWEALCRPCYIPSEDRKEGEWWSDFEEVIHVE